MPLFESGAFNHSAISPGFLEIICLTTVFCCTLKSTFTQIYFIRRLVENLFMEQTFNASFVDPETVVRQSQVSPGATVVDFGCGSGFFSFAFARAVGEEGKVYAMDILPSALEAVASRAKHLGLTNIFPQRANLERVGGTRLEESSVDWVLMKDVLFQNKNKEAMLAEAWRILRAGGRVFVMEWNELDQGVGPETTLRLEKATLMDLAERGGFGLVQEFLVGDFHYGFVFEKRQG